MTGGTANLKAGTTLEFFDVGVLTAPHGVRGELMMTPLTDVPGRLTHLRSAFLLSPDRRQHRPVALTCRPHQGRWRVSLDGVADRDAADALRGWTVAITRQQAEPLPAGRYFVRDLIGLRVVDEQLGEVGRLKDILTDRVQDLYVIAREGRPDALFPAVPDILLAIDPAAGEIQVRLPRGLLDVY